MHPAVSNTEKFSATAQAALSFLKALVTAGERQTRREQIPSLIELQTICREAGCDFADLNTFARVRDEGPALLLCGGDESMAHSVAGQIGYDLDFHSLPDAPLAWVVAHSSVAHLSLRRADTDRRITRKVLAGFLQNELKLDDFVFIEERVTGKSRWRFVWVPRPDYLVQFLSKTSALEILAGQLAAVVITEDTPEPVDQLLRLLDQKQWRITRDHWEQGPRRTALLAEVSTLLLEPDETRELRAVSLWHFVSERLLEQIARVKQTYNLQIEQQGHKLHSLRQLLSQHQHTWTGGLHGIIETHFQQRMKGKSFAAFFDVRQTGPDVQSFLAAAGLPALFTKVEQFVMDRMADFAGGLDGLALRLELQRITFGEMNARWTPRPMAPRLEPLLTERKIFEIRSEKSGGIMAKVTGKAPAIVDQRKGQISQACREISRAIGSDYSEWCTGFMNVFEQNIRLQFTAALANQGLPDVDHLRTAMEGFDRLSHRIRHFQQSTRTSEIVAAEWLRQLATRRWIPLYHSR